MNDDFDIKLHRDHGVDFSQILKAYDCTMRVGKRTDIPEGSECPGCGKDHSKSLFMLITLHGEDGKNYNLAIFDDTPLWNSILTGEFAESARACLAQLEAADL